ncbi:MAG: DUF503 domain-containing protein [Candidatus Eisenbacteria bacterium]
MFLAVSRFEIFIPCGRSLKAKRSVVVGLKERLRARFHAAVSEVDTQELWQRATLGVCLVGTRPAALAAGLAAVRRLVEENSRCQLTSWEGRVLAFTDLAERADFIRSAGETDGTADAGSDGPADRETAWYETQEGDEVYGAWERPTREDDDEAPPEDGQAGEP